MSKKKHKVGEVPEGKIGVYDQHGHLRGHVGPHATSATATRFTEQRGAVLGEKDGRKAWLTPNQKYNADMANRTKAGAKATPGQLVAAGALK